MAPVRSCSADVAANSAASSAANSWYWSKLPPSRPGTKILPWGVAVNVTEPEEKQLEEAVILSAVRTPVGTFNGAFSDVSAVELGQSAVAEALRRAGVPAEKVDEVLMG